MNRDSSKNQRPVVVHIPQMHPELAGGNSPAAVRFFNPGLVEAEDDRYYFPSGLPLDSKQARKALRAFLQLSDQFRRPGDLTDFARSGLEQWGRRPGLSESESADLGQFLMQQGLDSAQVKVPSPGTQPSIPASVHSQQVLLLAWSMEERILDFQNASGKYSDALSSFGQALGLEEGDGEDPGGLVEFSRAYPENVGDMAPPWALVVEHMVRFLPQGVALLTSETRLRHIWEERGISFESCSETDLEVLQLAADQGASWCKAELEIKDLTGGRTSAIPGLDSLSFIVYAPAEVK